MFRQRGAVFRQCSVNAVSAKIFPEIAKKKAGLATQRAFFELHGQA
jgi:hypothetical protein